jgi:hypothetical protein
MRTIGLRFEPVIGRSSPILLKNATMWVKWFSDLDGNGAG